MMRALAPEGTEWLVDASGCSPDALRSLRTFQDLFACIVDELGLRPVREPVWHVFPGEAGLSGMVVLHESHLACHTFPEHGYAAFSLYCCRPRPEWPWSRRLAELLGARSVTVRAVSRGRGEPEAARGPTGHGS
jgi:S-adenosylmethionine decarboxylase